MLLKITYADGHTVTTTRPIREGHCTKRAMLKAMQDHNVVSVMAFKKKEI